MLTHESFHPFSPDDAIVMLGKYLNGTYFLYKGEYYMSICMELQMDHSSRLLRATFIWRTWNREHLLGQMTSGEDQAQAFTDYLSTIEDDTKC